MTTAISMDGPFAVAWPDRWRDVPLWAIFERIKDVGHPNEEMLSVYRDHGVVKKDSRDDNANKTAENRNIYQLVDDGWLVVNRMKAWQGSVGISRYRGIVSGHYICFRPRHNEDHRFLNYLLRSNPYTLEYQRLSRGVRPNQIEIDNDELRSIVVRLPPLEEQRRIADFLDAETNRISVTLSARKAQIGLLGERFVAELVQAMRLGVKGAPGWHNTRLKYLFNFECGGVWGEEPSGDDEDTRCVRVADFNRSLFRTRQDPGTLRRVENSQFRSRALRNGDVLLEKSGGGEASPVGFAISYQGEGRAVCSNFVSLLRPAQGVDARFAALLLAACYTSRRNIPFIKQTTGIQNLDVKAYLSQVVCIPGKAEQIELVEKLDAALHHTESATVALSEQDRLLHERRHALITAAVTGQIDVTTARGVG